MVEEGADVEALGDEGDRPLHLAAREGHLEEVRVLVEAGANVEAELAGGERPLHLAAQGGHAEVVRMLLEAGADVEAQKLWSYAAVPRGKRRAFGGCGSAVGGWRRRGGSDASWVKAGTTRGRGGGANADGGRCR